MKIRIDQGAAGRSTRAIRRGRAKIGRMTEREPEITNRRCWRERQRAISPRTRATHLATRPSIAGENIDGDDHPGAELRGDRA